MDLLTILSKYKKEDALEMEQESLVSQDNLVGLSPTELWELEKLEEKPRDFFTFHNEMTSQSIKIEK